MLAGLCTAHALLPPHPGPLAAIGILKADAGRTILYSLLIGFPTAIVAGPVFARWITHRVQVLPGGIAAQLSSNTTAAELPAVGNLAVPELAECFQARAPTPQ